MHMHMPCGAGLDAIIAATRQPHSPVRTVHAATAGLSGSARTSAEDVQLERWPAEVSDAEPSTSGHNDSAPDSPRSPKRGEGKRDLHRVPQSSLLRDEQFMADIGSDSSEDERPARNTIGNVPLEWYNDEDHIGYDRYVPF